MKTKIILLFPLYGIIEALCFIHLEDPNRNLDTYIPYFIFLAIFFIIIASILIEVYGKEYWPQTVIICCTGQFVQDFTHIMVYGMITGKYQLWTPLWALLGISFPIPLFWILDLVAVLICVEFL